MYSKNISLSRLNLYGIISLLIFVILLNVLLIYKEYSDFGEESLRIQKNFFLNQKETIKKDTLRALTYISLQHDEWKGKMDEQTLKQNIIDTLNNFRDEKDGSGYIFVYTFDGVNIVDPILKQNYGKNLLDFQDSDGVYVIKDLIDVAHQQDGGYVEYRWNKPTTSKITKKISYAKAYEPWGWMVGTGIYLDDINSMIEESRQKSREKLMEYIINIVTLSLVMFLLFIIGIRTINTLIQRQISAFVEFFKLAITEHAFVDKKEVFIDDFKEMRQYLNEMVHELHAKTVTLKDLNENLEERVQIKTQKLKEQKQFSDSLVEAQDRFIKNSIHEINTPLSVIITHIDLFNMKHEGNKYIANIESAAKIILNIQNDLTYMIKKDRIDYPKQRLNLTEFLEERIAFFKDVALSNKLRVKLMIDKDLQVDFNDTELQRLIDNNISNAIKYAYTGTEILVELKEKRLLVKTLSNKINDLEGIFKVYVREDESRGGFGIGLQIVKSICDKNGVVIDVVSDETMTTFIYDLAGVVIEDTVA
jgi:signal transduction histidine kinase